MREHGSGNEETYPKNHCIKNGKLAALYLHCLRRGWRRIGKAIGLMLGCQIACAVPKRLFIPHPLGIVTGEQAQLADDVVLLQQVTLGCKSPYAGVMKDDGDPILKEGVYVGPGAKILGRITIGEWSIIGANAVVTESVPAYSIVVGHNKVLRMKSTELSSA